jgi:hypothetical protein
MENKTRKICMIGKFNEIDVNIKMLSYAIKYNNIP